MISTIRDVPGRFLRYAHDRAEFAGRAREIDFSPILSPWSRLRRDHTEIGRLRRLALASLWMSVPSMADRLYLLFLAVVWTPRVWLRAARLTRRHGRYVQADAGVAPMAQWRDAVLAAARFNYSPTAYFCYRFFEDTQPMGAYVQLGELTLLQYRDSKGVIAPVMRDKIHFFEECTRLRLPTPPIVALFAPGGEERILVGEPGTLPRDDLFVKDAVGQQGEGGERWAYDRHAERWVRHGARNDQGAMLDHLRERGEKRVVVVQSVVRSHPRIERYAPNALCTLRVMTFYDRDVDAEPKLIRSCFKMARAGSDVDNMHAGGLASAVDPSTGTLGVGRGAWPSDGTHTHHPDTGAEIVGAVLPFFREAIDLALLAHGKMTGLPWSVGWDVAISPEGPLLIEGNPYWSADLAQAPGPAPFDPDFVTRLTERLKGGEPPASGQPTSAQPALRGET